MYVEHTDSGIMHHNVKFRMSHESLLIRNNFLIKDTSVITCQKDRRTDYAEPIGYQNEDKGEDLGYRKSVNCVTSRVFSKVRSKFKAEKFQMAFWK